MGTSHIDQELHSVHDTRASTGTSALLPALAMELTACMIVETLGSKCKHCMRLNLRVIVNTSKYRH